MLHEVITAQSIKRLCFVLSRQSPGLHHEVMFRITNVCTNSILQYLTLSLSTFSNRTFGGGEDQEKKLFFSPRRVKIEAQTDRAQEGQHKYRRGLSLWGCSHSKISPISTTPLHYCQWRRVGGTSTAQFRLDWYKRSPHVRHSISMVSPGQASLFYFDFLRHLSGFKSFWNCMWILG